MAESSGFSLDVELRGIRGAAGRFSGSTAVFAARFAEARELAASTQETYARGAPRGKGELVGRGKRFADSFNAAATTNGWGFRLVVSTSQTDLRKWIRDGTAPHTISVKNKRVLANAATGQFFGTTVRHPGTKPNRWEEDAQHKAEEELIFFGNRLSASVKSHLSGGLARVTSGY